MSAFSFIYELFMGIDGKKYHDTQPKFTIEDYFNGDIKAWGIIQERNGNIVHHFDITMQGCWGGDGQANKGILNEEFTYYKTGEIQNRQWHITKHDEYHYEGTADDIIGTAIGQAHGNAMHWQYEMDVPVDDTHYRLKFDDWMWAMNDGVVINRSYMKKFGITVAELTVFMQKI